MNKKIIVWFRNDLRLHDHEPLVKALAKATEIIPVYCFDPRHFAETYLEFPKTDGFRAKFLIESVSDVRKSLQKIGGNLIVRVGKPENILPDLALQVGAAAVYASKEVTQEETSVEDALEAKLWKNKISLEFFKTSTLFHPDDIPYPNGNLPDIFTEFRKEVEKTVKIRPTFKTPESLTISKEIQPGEIPSLEDLGLEINEKESRAVLDFKGGETEGLERMQNYFWKLDLLRKYKDTRNGLLGPDYSSKFSAWLANGCLSPRKIYEEIKRYERERIKNDSTYWLIFELIWRDYFHFVARKYGNRIFQIGGIHTEGKIKLYDNHSLFEKWKNGETGIPFIDANMRELKTTGFMSNRGRQNVASFLVKDLKINWLWGAMWFESQLIDYDVCSNWGNWTYVAGVGNDPRENRYFNIISQAQRYDPHAEYIKHWLSELADVPPKKIHQLADLPIAEQRQYGVIVGVDYPQPLVSAKKWLVG